MGKAPSVFDFTKLKWMNGEYIKAMDFDAFYELALPYLKQSVKSDIDLKMLAGFIQSRIGTFNDIAIHGLDALEMITGHAYTDTFFVRQWNQYAVHAPHFCDSAQFMGALANGASVMADISYSAPDAAFSLPSYWRFTFWGNGGYLECRLGEGAVTIACSQDTHPRKIAAASVSDNCITDLIKEIDGEKNRFDTSSVLKSSRIALLLQHAANQTGKDEKP